MNAPVYPNYATFARPALSWPQTGSSIPNTIPPMQAAWPASSRIVTPQTTLPGETLHPPSPLAKANSLNPIQSYVLRSTIIGAVMATLSMLVMHPMLQFNKTLMACFPLAGAAVGALSSSLHSRRLSASLVPPPQ